MTTKISNRITDVFKKRKEDEKIMSLFLTAGYPDPDSTAELIVGFEQHGADMIELGMPFSDPLADGPTIQYSSEAAIKNGITMKKIFDIIKQVRKESQIPIILMGYINPVLRYGIDRFCEDAANAEADGLIIPDLPVEESALIHEQAKKNGLNLIFLVAPNTRDKRMKKIDEISEGFVYCVSVTGVTGARDGDEVARSVEKFINRINKNVQQNPKLIGFGIKNYADAQQVAKDVDGFIVGSALIDIIRNEYPNSIWKNKIYSFVHELKYGNS